MRRFEFPVDLPHAKSVNQTLAEVRGIRRSAILVAVLFAVGAGWLIYLGEPWQYVLGAVFAVLAATSLWVAVWAPRKVGTVEELYHNSPLVPAVVAGLRPRGVTLMALIDIAKPESETRHYALVTRKILTIPGRTHRVGDRMPCVAVLSDRSTRNTTGVWQMASPMPIAWGTRDQKVIADATAAIDEAEWTLLASKLKLADEVNSSETGRLELDSSDLPPELR